MKIIQQRYIIYSWVVYVRVVMFLFYCCSLFYISIICILHREYRSYFLVSSAFICNISVSCFIKILSCLYTGVLQAIAICFEKIFKNMLDQDGISVIEISLIWALSLASMYILVKCVCINLIPDLLIMYV